MRVFISGSAPLLPQTFAAFEERTGHAILGRYGMTEAGMIASNPYDGARVAGTVGYPLPDTEARLQGGGDGPGVLESRGPGLFSGSWRLPDKPAEEHASYGWFIPEHGSAAWRERRGLYGWLSWYAGSLKKKT